MLEKKTKKHYFTGIWLALAIISFIVLSSFAFSHINEISVVKLGNRIEAEYYEDSSGVYARYYDEEGNLHTYNLTGYFPVHEKDRITLYYANSIDEAQPANTLTSWLGYYAFFGVIFAVSMWRLNANTKSKKHS